MQQLALARKWRPHRFEEVIGQPHVVQALSNALNQQHLHHAYLLTGTRGVGKTTLARILAKCLNCEEGISANPCDRCQSCEEIDAGRFVDLFEVDAASRTKVEDTRELLDNVQYLPTKGRYKVYLIDEVHMLSGHSFNALLKTLEEPPKHVIFLLATTDHQKLPATVLSRCLQFHLQQMPAPQVAQHLQTILTKENIPFDESATLLLGKAANGSMRDALSLLDQSIAYGNGSVREVDVKNMLGTIEPTHLFDILSALAKQDANALLSACETLSQQGVDYARALSELLHLLHQIALSQFTNTAESSEQIQQLARELSREDVQLYYQIGLLGQRDLPLAPTPRSGFEMTLLRMLAFMPEAPGTPQVKTSAATKITSAPNTTSTHTNNWAELLQALNLNGATLALAQQCRLVSHDDHQFLFSIDAKHQPLLSQKQVARMQAALTEHLQKNILVKVNVGIANTQTPAELSRQQQQHRQQTAQQRILDDEHVQQIIRTFDATLVEDSITTLN